MSAVEEPNPLPAHACLSLKDYGPENPTEGEPCLGTKAAAAEDSTLIGGSSPKVAEVTCCDGREATGTTVLPIHGPDALAEVPKKVKAESAISINHNVASEAVPKIDHTNEEDTFAS